MSLKINDERPVIVANETGNITSVEAVAAALGVSVEKVRIFKDQNGAIVLAFCYLGPTWTVTSALDSDGSILFNDGSRIYGGNTGETVPTSTISRISFYGGI